MTRHPQRHRAVDERLAHRMDQIHRGDGKIALAPMEPVVRHADPPFRAFEIRQHIGVAPAAIAALRPMGEIRLLAAIVDHTVDRA